MSPYRDDKEAKKKNKEDAERMEANERRRI